MISEPRHLRDYIDRLASGGRYHFSTPEAQAALNASPAAVRLALSRLGRQRLIASPARGFYVVVPPEYRSLGSLPAEQFIPALMKFFDLDYYVGLLSAAQYHGAAHHRPQEFQVFLEQNRRPISVGAVRVSFIARKNLKAVNTCKINTLRGSLTISTPEATAIDLAGYPEHGGGLDHVATVLGELAEKINPDLLVEEAANAPLPWVQRLGYLLDTAEVSRDATEPLRRYVRDKARNYVLLAPSGARDGDRFPDWKLIVNEQVEVEF